MDCPFVRPFDGGPVQLYGLLALSKEVGGVKKFKDLLDAMSATGTNAIPV